MDKCRTTPVRIAVAEDDPAVRKTFVRLLEALGHLVVCAASDGEELVDGCVAGEVDLVFTDFHLPVMDGLAAAELIASKGIPVVLISGHPDAREIVVDCEPVAMLIRKPVTIDDVQTAIARVVCRR
jgi:CheY-like chemotaxis protein